MTGSDKQRVQYKNGPLAGADVELPADLDPMKANLVISPGGVVYHRANGRPVKGARVLELPHAHRKPNGSSGRRGPSVR